MKSIRNYLIPVLFLLFAATNLNAQNSIKEDGTPVSTSFTEASTNIMVLDNYCTEADFNEKHHISNKKRVDDSEFYYGDDAHNEGPVPMENDGMTAAIVAEVMVEVIINVAFIVAAFWQ